MMAECNGLFNWLFVIHPELESSIVRAIYMESARKDVALIKKSFGEN